VKERWTKEIVYWDHRAEELKSQEKGGEAQLELNSGEARKRADGLQARLEKRMADLQQERQISPLPPVALGGLLNSSPGPAGADVEQAAADTSPHGQTTQASAARARAAVMESSSPRFRAHRP